MNFINSIKPLFPVTFNLEKFLKLNFKDNAELLTMLVKVGIYLAIGIIVGIVFGIAGLIIGLLNIEFLSIVVGAVLGTVSGIVGIYNLAGIILTVLDFAKVFEPKN